MSYAYPWPLNVQVVVAPAPVAVAPPLTAYSTTNGGVAYYIAPAAPHAMPSQGPVMREAGVATSMEPLAHSIYPRTGAIHHQSRSRYDERHPCPPTPNGTVETETARACIY